MASILVNSPKVLLLDEPTIELDLENSDLELIKFCKIISKFGVVTENIKNVDELFRKD